MRSNDEDEEQNNDRGKSERQSSSSSSSPNNNNSNNNNNANAALLRRFALFVDGASRAQVLPYVPWLLYRLLLKRVATEVTESQQVHSSAAYAGAADGGGNGDAGGTFGGGSATATADTAGDHHDIVVDDGSCWDQVGYSLSWIIASYVLGRWLGSSSLSSSSAVLASSGRCSLSTKKHDKLHNNNTNKLVVCVSRLGGVAVSLYACMYYYAGFVLLAFSNDSANFRWMIAMRFLLAVVCGLLCRITRQNDIILPEDKYIQGDTDAMTDEEKRKTTTESVTSVEEAKFYMTGFALSALLSGGLVPLLVFRREATAGTATTTGRSQYHQSYNIAPSSSSWWWSLLPLLFIFISIAVGFEILLRRVLFAASSAVTTNHDADTDINKKSPSKIDDEMVSFVVGGMNEDDNNNEEVGDTVGAFLDPLSMSSRNRGRACSYDFLSPTRSRRESRASSVDEFFDCRSVLSEDFDESAWDDNNNNNKSGADLRKFARYVNHRCVYDDGSPAFVSNGNCIADVPSNFVEFYNGNHDRAQRAWEDTQTWRKEKRVWRIHTLPNTWFTQIKAAYPHFIHGHSKSGYPVIYEQPGRMELKGLFRSGCDISDMIHHYTFFMEFISNCISTKPDIRSLQGHADAVQQHNAASWGIIVVMDIKGAGLSHLSGDVLSYLKQAGNISSQHYPMSMKRALLVNSPFWLAGAFSGLKGLLPESVQADILSESKCLDGLRQYIDEDQIPAEYGGASPYSLGEHPYEIELRQLVEMAESCGGGDEEIRSSDEASELPHLISSSDASEDFPDNREVEFPNQLSMTTIDLTPGSSVPLRRRVGSLDYSRRRQETGIAFSNSRPRKQGNQTNSEVHVLVIVSVIYSLFTAVQGALEVTIPLWILSPAHMGGLGYSSFRSGFGMFSASLVLLYMMRFKPSSMISQLPNRAPMRAFRIGVGAESVLLAALTVVSAKTSVDERSDSIVVMASTIIIVASMALAFLLGRSACNILHQVAYEGIQRRPKHANWTASAGWHLFIRYPIAEVAGIFIVAPLLSYSMSSHQPAPFDVTFVFTFTSLLNFVLYCCTFSLSATGEIAPQHVDRCSCQRRLIPFIGDIIAVSAGDMASLFQEANWSSTPLLGHSRRRAFSDTLKMVERGEGEDLSNDKAK